MKEKIKKAITFCTYVYLLIMLTTITFSIIYKKGYNDREKRFQDYPILFLKGGYPVMRVDNNSSGKTIVEILESNLIEIK